MLAQEPHRIGVDPAHLATILLRVPVEEEEHQGLDVLPALAQRGQVDRHDVEPVIQVFPEPADLDLLEQVAVGRGDDPGVDLLGVVVADPLELALLQDAEQLDLELGRGAVDLVEEDAAGVGRLEPAGAVVDGAGERALDVAEQLALEQALGQRAAVDPDVGPVDRGLRSWMARAISSLPVPVSPTIRTQAREGATWRVVRTTSCKPALPPMMPGRAGSSTAASWLLPRCAGDGFQILSHWSLVTGHWSAPSEAQSVW